MRPFVIATDNTISASPSQSYKFMIICSPAQSYYSGEVRVLISEDYSRAADGGIGYAKAAGNYAGQFFLLIWQKKRDTNKLFGPMPITTSTLRRLEL